MNCFGKDRIAFDLQIAEAKQLAFVDRHRDAQHVIRRRKERQRQNGKARAAPAEAFDARLAMSRLQITLRPHVVINQMQVVVELLAMQNVLLFNSREQAGFLDVLHLAAKLAALENLAALKFNLSHAHARRLRQCGK